MSFMSQSAYARSIGVNVSTISRAVKDGRIPLRDDGLIDSEVADVAMRENTDNSKANRRGKKQGRPTYSDSRARREEYLARIKRLEYQELAGKLVRVDVARMAWFKLARRARDLILAIPDRIAPIMAGTDDASECHRIMTDELRKVCVEMQKQPRYKRRGRLRGEVQPGATDKLPRTGTD